MKKLNFKIKDFPRTAHQPLQTIFIYNLNKHLESNSLAAKNVIPYSVMQGCVTLDCSSSYDEIRTEQIVNTVVRTINLYGTENSNFEEYTDREKEKLHRLLTERNSDSKKQAYYKAVKELMKQRVYPPLSVQKALIQEAKDFEAADETEETEIKQGNLQTNSWLWTRIVSVFPNNPLRKEATYLATELELLGIKGIEELTLLTTHLTKRMLFVGTTSCCRLAIKSEAENVNNIRNIMSKQIEIYKTQTDKYLTAACSALFTRNVNNVKTMYEILKDVNCKLDYELRFSDLTQLSKITDYRTSAGLAEEQWIKFILANKDIIANILTAIGLHAKQLLPLWRVSMEEIEYPESFDELQVYYESQGLDIDTLSELMSIDAEEGNTKQMLQTIKKYGVRHQSDQLPYDIALQALKKKQITLSEKQYAIIEKRYKSIMKTQEMSKTIDASECLKLANELDRRFKGQLNKTTESIVNSTLRYGICSERQLEVMRLSYVALTTAAEKTNTAEKTDGIKIGESGLMFGLPDKPAAPPTSTKPNASEEETYTDEDELTKTTKSNLITDAYKHAFSEGSSTSNQDSDSIWAD